MSFVSHGGVRPYTPNRENTAALVRRTVGRERILKRIRQSLTSAARTGNRSHTLLIGPRGSGKSHLVDVALGLLREDPVLRDRFAIVSVPEDAIGLTRFDDLVSLVVSVLSGQRPTRGQTSANLQVQIAELLSDRVLLLTIENLDRFMSAIGTSGQRAFRSWVESSGQVLLLATTPLIFSAVHDRDQPFFGAFDHTPVPDLTPEEGHQLLLRLATDAGDETLRSFLDSEVGRRRVRAVAELTGGSPRIWMILAGCLEPARLDELIPTVQDLLEQLTPYYQQLLWELPPNEQRVVRALAEQDAGALTVNRIADESDLPQAVTSTTLKRLVASRWVESVKAKGGDRRKTWYRLREPLLRHHFQYRSGDRRPLTLIVAILKIVFDPDERRRHLIEVDLNSAALLHLARTFDDQSIPADSAYAGRDVESLQSEARRWMAEEGEWARQDAGRAIDEAVRMARSSNNGGPDLADVVGQELTGALSALPGRTWSVVALVEACWNSSLREPSETLATMRQIMDSLDPDDPFCSLVLSELAHSEGLAGNFGVARDHSTELIGDRTAKLGPDHPDTRDARQWHAYWVGKAGDPAAARDLLAALVAESASLDPDNRETIRNRRWHAYWVGQAGDAAAARDLLAAIAAESTSKLGPHDPDTRDARWWHAHWVGQAGDPVTARDLFTDVVADTAEALGADHTMTHVSRWWWAYWTRATGDYLAARDLFAALVSDRSRTLGPKHQDTHQARVWQAAAMCDAGDSTGSLAVSVDLVDWLGHGGLHDSIAQLNASIIELNLTRLLSSSGPAPDDSDDLVQLLVSARDGSEEALVELPVELADVVQKLKDPNFGLS